jgi:hypothetical protein
MPFDKKDVLIHKINAQAVDDGEALYQFTWQVGRKSVVLDNASIEKTLRFEQENLSICPEWTCLIRNGRWIFQCAGCVGWGTMSKRKAVGY